MGQRGGSQSLRGPVAVHRVWDVVRVPFPYTDRPVRERRPALVVAIPTVGDAPPLLWVLMVTSAANRGWPGDVEIADLRRAGLPAPSVVRTEKLATINADEAETLGQLDPEVRGRVSERLREQLASALAG